MAEQKKIVVTGGSSGVGQALVARLLEKDCQVFNLDRQPPIEKSQARFIECDLSDEVKLDQCMTQLPDRIDGLANVAGIAQAEDPSKVIAVNFLGLRHLTRSLLPRLIEGGSIVSVSSIAGRDWLGKYDLLKPVLETGSFSEGLTWCSANNDHLWRRDPYSFSKRCVTAFTQREAEKGISNNFRINTVSPGPIDTPLYPEFESLMTREHSEWTKDQTGRGALPNDIAEILEFLVIGECGWLNGVDIPVDGGYSAGSDAGWIDLKSSPAYLARQKRRR